MYELLKKDGMAKRGRFHTVHGTIETPVFMNVGRLRQSKELYQRMISVRLKHRLNCQIHIISMSDQG